MKRLRMRLSALLVTMPRETALYVRPSQIGKLINELKVPDNCFVSSRVTIHVIVPRSMITKRFSYSAKRKC